MNKLILATSAIFVLALSIYVVIYNPQEGGEEKEVSSNKISIVTTLFPMYDFAQNVGGDKVEVTLLLPPGTESHGFEPKPSDIIKLNQADIFIYTGDFMEPWAKDFTNSLRGEVKIVNASTGTKMIEESEEEEHEEDEHEGVDPHIWLDFENAKIMTDNITQALVEIDSANKNLYEENSKIYKEKLTSLDDSYIETLNNCSSNKVVHGGHFAFGYVADRYNLDYMSAQGFSADSEPTAKDLISLVSQIRDNNINYVFYEELTSPKVAETLASETKTELLLLNAAHNLSRDDFENKITYISIMKENLNNLSIGLNCQK